MKVRVRLFARAKDLAGTDVLALDLLEGTTVGDLRRLMAQQNPALECLLQQSAFAVNGEFARDPMLLPIEAEIALLPPVSGG